MTLPCVANKLLTKVHRISLDLVEDVGPRSNAQKATHGSLNTDHAIHSHSKEMMLLAGRAVYLYRRTPFGPSSAAAECAVFTGKRHRLPDMQIQRPL